MSTGAMEAPATRSEADHPPAPSPVDAAQDAVDCALESAQRLVAELRSARFAALMRHTRNVQM